MEYIQTLRFWGITGAYLTGASIGGLEVSENYYISVGNYENYNKEESTVRNIYVNITDKDYLRTPNTKTIYLTDYKKGSNVTVSTPQLVKINENTFLVLWNETDKSGMKVHSQIIDENGNKVTEKQSFQGSLSDCQPILQNGQVVWYYTGTEKGDTAPILCRIAVDGNKTSDNLFDGETDQAGDSGNDDEKNPDDGTGSGNPGNDDEKNPDDGAGSENLGKDDGKNPDDGEKNGL